MQNAGKCRAPSLNGNETFYSPNFQKLIFISQLLEGNSALKLEHKHFAILENESTFLGQTDFLRV